jgi:hypothetical protein
MRCWPGAATGWPGVTTGGVTRAPVLAPPVATGAAFALMFKRMQIKKVAKSLIFIMSGGESWWTAKICSLF